MRSALNYGQSFMQREGFQILLMFCSFSIDILNVHDLIVIIYLTPRKHCKTVATPHINMVMPSSCARTSCSSAGQSNAANMNGKDNEPPMHITAC